MHHQSQGESSAARPTEIARATRGSKKLTPSPSRIIKKTGNATIKDIQPSNPSFKPTDLTACKCTGLFQGSGAVITMPEHIWALIKLGFYGKGSFSRTIPCHHRVPSLIDLRQISRKRKSSGMPTDTVINRWEKRIKLHSQWKDEEVSDLERGKEEEYPRTIDDTLPTKSSDTPTKSSREGDDDYDYDEFLARLKEIKGRDPFVIDEYLQLGPEETFYLVNELKVLNIVSAENIQLGPQELWTHFINHLPSFAVKYAAYKHFRTGNWTPKSGLKFGVDFLLYKIGPLYYHSSYAVMVREANSQQKITWKEVVTITRACQATGKDFLICDVSVPVGVDIKDPVCVEQLAIVDEVVKWWVPEQDREM